MPFANPDSTYDSEAAGLPVSVVVPLTGTTIQMRYDQRDLYIQPAGTLAALTIKLPQAQSGQFVNILCTAIVTALTMQDRNGAAITGLPVPPTAMTAGQVIQMRYINRTIGWTRWR